MCSISFCWCGLVSPCKKHHGQPVPEKRQKVGKYSGFSKFRAEKHIYQKNYKDPMEERWPDED